MLFERCDCFMVILLRLLRPGGIKCQDKCLPSFVVYCDPKYRSNITTNLDKQKTMTSFIYEGLDEYAISRC